MLVENRLCLIFYPDWFVFVWAESLWPLVTIISVVFCLQKYTRTGFKPLQLFEILYFLTLLMENSPWGSIFFYNAYVQSFWHPSSEKFVHFSFSSIVIQVKLFEMYMVLVIVFDMKYCCSSVKSWAKGLTGWFNWLTILHL